MKINPSVI